MTESAAESRIAWRAIAIHRDDDVAVALRDLAPGVVDVRIDGDSRAVEVVDRIPLGHKLALHPIAAGAPVRKYGESIGVATSAIAAGAHVHVHNLASRRARATT